MGLLIRVCVFRAGDLGLWRGLVFGVSGFKFLCDLRLWSFTSQQQQHPNARTPTKHRTLAKDPGS